MKRASNLRDIQAIIARFETDSSLSPYYRFWLAAWVMGMSLRLPAALFWVQVALVTVTTVILALAILPLYLCELLVRGFVKFVRGLAKFL